VLSVGRRRRRRNPRALTGLKAPDFVKSNQMTTLEELREMSPYHRSRRGVKLSKAEK